MVVFLEIAFWRRGWISLDSSCLGSKFQEKRLDQSGSYSKHTIAKILEKLF